MTGLFSFSENGCLTLAKEFSLPNYFTQGVRQKRWAHSLIKNIYANLKAKTLSRIWTRVAESISYDDSQSRWARYQIMKDGCNTIFLPHLLPSGLLLYKAKHIIYLINVDFILPQHPVCYWYTWKKEFWPKKKKKIMIIQLGFRCAPEIA